MSVIYEHMYIWDSDSKPKCRHSNSIHKFHEWQYSLRAYMCIYSSSCGIKCPQTQNSMISHTWLGFHLYKGKAQNFNSPPLLRKFHAPTSIYIYRERIFTHISVYMKPLLSYLMQCCIDSIVLHWNIILCKGEVAVRHMDVLLDIENRSSYAYNRISIH